MKNIGPTEKLPVVVDESEDSDEDPEEDPEEEYEECIEEVSKEQQYSDPEEDLEEEESNAEPEETGFADQILKDKKMTFSKTTNEAAVTKALDVETAHKERRRTTRWDLQPEQDGEMGENDNGIKIRKTRWGSDVSQLKTVAPVQLPECVSDFVDSESDAELKELKQKLVAINRVILSLEVYNGKPAQEESMLNQKENLVEKRQKLLQELIIRNSKLRPPQVSRKVYAFSRKVYVPVKEHPSYNFIGLIMGPRRNTLKKMEAETGATIKLQGKGFLCRDPELLSDNEDLHVHIEAHTQNSLEAAVAMVEKLLIPRDDKDNELLQAQLAELANLKCTRSNTCKVCNESGHMSYACPNRTSTFEKVSACTNCGDVSHRMSHCPSLPQVSRKVYVPVKEYPSYNFVGLILGPRGNTLKKMEEETGATIKLRGKGFVCRDPKILSDNEDLHVHIEARTENSLEAAVAMVEKLLIPRDDKDNEVKQAQLAELAKLKGTKSITCNVCNESGHKSYACPNRKSTFEKFSACANCGDISHRISHCPLHKKANPNGEINEANLFVGFLPQTVDENWLKERFCPFGKIISLKVMMDPATGLSRGCGFVNFESPIDAAMAVKHMNGYQLEGKTLAVRVAGLTPHSKLPVFNPPQPDPGPVAISACTKCGSVSHSISHCPLNTKSNPNREINEANLYVGFLPQTVDENWLKELFCPFGKIISVRVMTDLATGLGKGYGFVNFESPIDAAMAVKRLNGYQVYGKTLAVRVAGLPSQPTLPVVSPLPPYPRPVAISAYIPGHKVPWVGPPGAVLSPQLPPRPVPPYPGPATISPNISSQTGLWLGPSDLSQNSKDPSGQCYNPSLSKTMNMPSHFDSSLVYVKPPLYSSSGSSQFHGDPDYHGSSLLFPGDPDYRGSSSLFPGDPDYRGSSSLFTSDLDI